MNDSTDPGRSGDGFDDPWAPVNQPPYPPQPQDTPFGGPAYDADPYGAPPGPYRGPPAKNTSAVVLTVLSGIATVLCCLLGLPSLVLGIVALTRQSTDPQGSARMTRYGWVTFGVLVGLGAIAVVTLGAVGSLNDPTVNDFNGL